MATVGKNLGVRDILLMCWRFHSSLIRTDQVSETFKALQDCTCVSGICITVCT